MEKVQEIKDTARLSRPAKGRVGWQFSQRLALPRHKAIASLPNKYLEVMAGSGESALSAMARLMDQTVWMVSSARPPRVSATRGKKSVPVERQAQRINLICAILLYNLTSSSTMELYLPSWLWYSCAACLSQTAAAYCEYIITL